MKKCFMIVMSVAVLASCAHFLDTAPADQIATESMWTSESLADQGMIGLYKIFFDTNSGTSSIYCNSGNQDGFNRQNPMYLEFQTGCCGSNSNYCQYNLTRGTKDATTYDVQYMWQWPYTGIHRVNDAIENLYKAGLSDEKYDRYMCEAKFLRAFFYTRLNMYFQGVPIYLETISETECTRGQSTADEVWDVVIDDLTDCIECESFPDSTLGSDNYGRPSKGAAYSLRGIAYMWLAWEHGDDNTYYQLAANDFEKVADCGYGLWTGNQIDFFHYDNEKDHEMIFPIQYTEDSGFCDYLQMITAPRDMYQGWSQVRPSYDFVTYFKNADGTDFDWAERIPEWDNSEFLNDIGLREVFFLRDSIEVVNGEVQRTFEGVEIWDEDQIGLLQERVNALGDTFYTYYEPLGNVARIKSCYENRDPRLKDIVIVPYEPYDCYYSGYNAGNECAGKELRWPFVRTDTNGDYQDIYIGNSQSSTYLYSKYNYKRKGDLIDRLRCPTDWPLIRYTDVYLRLAECYVHLGRLSEAAAIVTEVRARSGMVAYTAGSTDETMEAVRYERRVELCLEGHDYFDEWRWGTYKDMKFQGNDRRGSQSFWGTWENYIDTWYYTDDMWPWGAPSGECQRNPNLTQKAGWAY